MCNKTVLFGSVLALLGCVAGCSRSTAARYIPTTTVAKEALSAALESWRQGNPSGDVRTYRVPIQVADTHRRPGQKLRSFDILGEVSVDGGRIFQVRLQLEQPEVEEKAQYVVVGIDPLWVFRREDYDMITHWDHATPPASENASVAAPDAGLEKSG